MFDLVKLFLFGNGEFQMAFLPLIPLAISGISALAGGLGNRAQTQKQTSQSSSTTTPTFDPTTLGFRNDIIGQYLSQLHNPLDLTGYQFGGIEDINKNSELAKQNTRENLAARGISGPAMDFALNRLDNNRFADITKFQQGIPLLQNQLRNQILQQAGGFFNTIPYGQSQTSSGTQTGTQPGNVAGGILGNLGSTLAYFLGQGAFKPQSAVPRDLGTYQ